MVEAAAPSRPGADVTPAQRRAKSAAKRAKYDARLARRAREAEEKIEAARRTVDADRIAAETEHMRRQEARRVEDLRIQAEIEAARIAREARRNAPCPADCAVCGEDSPVVVRPWFDRGQTGWTVYARAGLDSEIGRLGDLGRAEVHAAALAMWREAARPRVRGRGNPMLALLLAAVGGGG